jgi:hypothetical protein
MSSMVSGFKEKSGFALILACLVLLGFSPDASARTTPLGNSVVGTSNTAGGANGVPSPSGPGVHPGYQMVSFRNAINVNWRVGGIDWLSDGRMVAVLWGADCSRTNSSCGSEANSRTYYGDIQLPPDGVGPGSMHLVSGTAGSAITSANVQQIYTGLWEPLGVYVGRSGNPSTDTIFVITKTGLLRFIGTGPYTNGVNPVKVVNTCHARVCARDSVGPGLYKSFTSHPPVTYTGTGDSTGTGRRWHHFTAGLARDPQGYLYAATVGQYDNANTKTDQGRDRCAILKMDPVAGTQEVIAGGMRSPNGLVFGPEGELFSSDVQGNFNAANKIVNVRKGRFYGMRCDTYNPYGHTQGIPESFPVVALNQAGASNTDIGNNPAELVYHTQGPYKGQLFYGDVTFGGIQRVFLEKINNEWQGAVFLFSGGMHAGPGRLRMTADGTMYGAGQSGGPDPASGNWCWGGQGGVGALTADRNSTCNYQYDLFKMIPKDTVVFELLAVRARVNGFELQFTKKVGPSAGVLSNYTVQTWTNTLSVESYGAGSQQGGVSTITPTTVTIHPDSTRVFLAFASMPAASVRPVAPAPLSGSGNVRVVLIKGTGVLAADGSAPWGEPVAAGGEPSRIAAWYTLNYHSTDTAFAPVALADSKLASPDQRMQEFKVKAGRGVLDIETNFAAPARITLRDLRGKSMGTVNVAAGRNTSSLTLTTARARGTYVLEIRTGGRTLARTVPLF